MANIIQCVCGRALFSVVLVLTTTLPACKGKGGEAGAPGAAPSAAPEAVKISPEAEAEAQQIFATRCTPCHGPTGIGDGPTAKRLSPPPRNFQDPAWQAGTTDENIEQIIRFGGAAVGKSPGMPPNPDLLEKPEVVAALRAYVRKLRPAM